MRLNLSFLKLLIVVILNVIKNGCCDYWDDEEEIDKHKSMMEIVDVPPFEDIGTVNLTFYLEDVNSVNAKDMDFRIDYYLQHDWIVTKDYCDHYQKQLSIRQSNLTLDKGIIINDKSIIQSLFWIPDTYLSSAKMVEYPLKQSDTQMLEIHLISLSSNSPEVTCLMKFVAKLDAKASCQMNFHAYPIDIQHCYFNFRSYEFNSSIVQYKWNKPAYYVNPQIEMLAYSFTLNKSSKTTQTFIDTYSQLVIHFTLTRRIFSSLMQVYVPSALVVFVSWFAFFMGLDAIPGRVTLSVCALLAMVTQFSSVRSELPPVAYVNGADIWMLFCMILVFITMLEFTVIKYIDKSNEIAMIRERNKIEEKSLKSSKKDSKCSIEEDKFDDQIDTLNTDLGFTFRNIAQRRTLIPPPKEFGSEDNSGVWYTNDTNETTRRRSRQLAAKFILDTIIATKGKPKVKKIEAIQENSNKISKLVDYIDYLSRIIYFALFLIFNVIYWPLIMLRAL